MEIDFQDLTHERAYQFITPVSLNEQRPYDITFFGRQMYALLKANGIRSESHGKGHARLRSAFAAIGLRQELIDFKRVHYNQENLSLTHSVKNGQEAFAACILMKFPMERS